MGGTDLLGDGMTWRNLQREFRFRTALRGSDELD
jgi:hypothetical protein